MMIKILEYIKARLLYIRFDKDSMQYSIVDVFS